MNPKKPNKRVPRTGWKLPDLCSNPECQTKGSTKEMMRPSGQLIRGEEVACDIPKFQCEACGMTFQSPEQATIGVKIAVEAYQKQYGLLTAKELKAARKKLHIDSAVKLAERSDGILSESTLKRIETGVHAQDRSTDYLIRKKIEELASGDTRRISNSDFVIVIEMSNKKVRCNHPAPPLSKRTNDEEGWSQPFANLYAELESSNFGTTEFAQSC